VDDGQWRILRRKLYLTAVGIIAPELILMLAMGQYFSAKQTTSSFHDAVYKDWTLRHSYYADMGGFILHTRDWTPFPIDAKQLLYLITEGYVSFPRISTKTIDDKDKVDGLVRAITVLQTFWFVVNCIGRASQQLALTALELTTLGFIVCSAGTVICWAQKPSDVRQAEVLVANVTMAEIVLKASAQETHLYSRTPLDFATDRPWPWMAVWLNAVNLLRKMGIAFTPRRRPIRRLPNDNFPKISNSGHFALLCCATAYAATSICGWNFEFPTETERVLWRIASLIILGAMLSCFVLEGCVYHCLPWIRRHLHTSRRLFKNRGMIENGRPYHLPSRYRSRLERLADSMRNNSLNKDPLHYIPLKVLLPVYFAIILYYFARGYMFVEDIIELRYLPASAFKTVHWSLYIPHI